MPLLSDANLLKSESFMDRMTIALIRAAHNIQSEDGATTNHAERLAMSDQILTGWTAARRMAGVFFPLVAGNPTIQSVGTSATDNEIIFVVNSYLDQVAVRDFTAEAV